MKKIRFEPDEPKMCFGKRLVLSLPLLLSMGWITYIQVGKSTIQPGNELLAPADSGMLLMALSIFTVGYFLFLLLMFSEDIKKFFSKKHKH